MKRFEVMIIAPPSITIRVGAFDQMIISNMIAQIRDVYINGDTIAVGANLEAYVMESCANKPQIDTSIMRAISLIPWNGAAMNGMKNMPGIRVPNTPR